MASVHSSFLAAIILTICYIVSYSVTAADECTQVNRCSCKFANGSVIDISSLGRTDGYPRFKYEAPLSGNTRSDNKAGWKYAFNPCYGFKDTYKCSGVVGCQQGNTTDGSGEGGIIFNPLGDASSATFSNDGTTITYTSHTEPDNKTRKLTLSLVCDPSVKKNNPKLYRIGEFGDSDGNPDYEFLLVSVCACAGGCTT